MPGKRIANRATDSGEHYQVVDAPSGSEISCYENRIIQ